MSGLSTRDRLCHFPDVIVNKSSCLLLQWLIPHLIKESLQRGAWGRHSVSLEWFVNYFCRCDVLSVMQQSRSVRLATNAGLVVLDLRQWSLLKEGEKSSIICIPPAKLRRRIVTGVNYRSHIENVDDGCQHFHWCCFGKQRPLRVASSLGIPTHQIKQFLSSPARPYSTHPEKIEWADRLQALPTFA